MVNRAAYIAKRAGGAVFSFLIVATFLFFLFRAMPGDIVDLYTTPEMSPEQVARIRASYGLDEPLYVQYGAFMSNLFTGNLGESFRHRTAVTSVLGSRLLNTLVLFIPALVFGYIVGPLLGAYMAWNRGSDADTYGIGMILVFFAAPVFWTGMVFLMLFSFTLGWFPSGGIVSGARPTDTFIQRYLHPDFLHHLVLPLVVTSLYMMTLPTLFMRSTMIEKINEDFIEAARAQGLPDRSIMYRHAARNSMLPVFHHAAIAIGGAFGGSVLIEVVFSWPGVGRTMWEAVDSRDYPLAQGAFLVLAGAIITANFFVDMLSVYVDPRAAQDGED